MDIKVGPHWYRNADGLIQIEGLPQIEIIVPRPGGPLRVNFALFDEHGRLHGKLEASSLVINERGMYRLEKTATSVRLTNNETGRVVLDMKLTEGDRVEISEGEFYTLKGHLFRVTPLEWAVERTVVREGETDVKGQSVSLA
ncbi:MAG: hypothetical protein D6690_02890 [Nitrospirae bacterium]|nr:MAG: hypothetical protein D6690_02890 [Nitrospirota bacterium]